MYKMVKICLFIIIGSLLMADDSGKSKEMIPNVNLKDINKKKVNLVEASKDYYDLINFWNMACEHCKKEMNFLNPTF